MLAFLVCVCVTWCFVVWCGVVRYIRCVKPNPDKQSGRFDGEDVLLQLQYSGTMETIRIRQQVRHPSGHLYTSMR